MLCANMRFQRHLLLREIKLEAGQEWKEGGLGWLFLRLHRGLAYWLAKGVAKELNPGQVLIAPPNKEGELRASRLNETRFHCFYFCPELATDFLTSFEEHYLDKIAAQTAEHPRVVLPEAALARAYALLVEEGEVDNTFAPRAQMLRIAALAFSPEIVHRAEPVPLGGSVEQRFKSIIQQMPENELVRHTPEQLAALCECSTRHFSRLFRKHFGTSIRARQTELRLLKARQLLLETDAKITSVALESGYRHLGLFHIMFKKHLGMTPSEWKERELEKLAKTEAPKSSRADGSPQPEMAALKGQGGR